jgi:hypothetical protein
MTRTPCSASSPSSIPCESSVIARNVFSNPINPDPTVPVRWGDQTWEEMALGAFEVVVPRGAGPRILINRRNR